MVTACGVTASIRTTSAPSGPLSWTIATFLLVSTPAASSVLNGASARSGSSKNTSQTYCHCFTLLNASSGAQPVTIGTRLRSATTPPAFTSAGVQEPSSAVAWLRVISVSVLDEVVLGSVLSSSSTRPTFRLAAPTCRPPAWFTWSTACWYPQRWKLPKPASGPDSGIDAPMTISELEEEEELPAQPAASRATHATRLASTVVGRRAVARRRSPLNAIALTVSSIEIVCPVSQHSRLATSGYRRRHYELCQELEGICRCCQLTSIGREGGVALVERVVRAARRNGGLPPGAARARQGSFQVQRSISVVKPGPNARIKPVAPSGGRR